MTTTGGELLKTFTFIGLGLAVAVVGIYVAGADDAPGAPVLGMLLMVAGVMLGVKAVRQRLPVWIARTTLALGLVVAATTAFLIHAAVVTASPFRLPHAVPSVVGPAPPQAYAAAVDRAREFVRAAVVEQHLAGVSVAVGTAAGTVLWAEGFGWRDFASQAPVTPDTRFNIGTASSAVFPLVEPLGLTNTGADPVADWSPGHLGEPEDDFPPFTLIRHVVFRPLGLAPDLPLPGNRATSYVPRSDDDPVRGRREMYMRDMACCGDGMAFYSTPSDLVRIAEATNRGSIDGLLAGGMVMSLVVSDGGIVVAVTSNIAHTNTSALAIRVGDAFAQSPR